MDKNRHKQSLHVRRHRRVRKRVFGLPDRPRLCVNRSNNNIFAQVIDDVNAVTLASASSRDRALRDEVGGGNCDAARKIGEHLGKRAMDLGIHQVIFDRGGYAYHGRVKALAEGARKAGLVF